MSDCSIVYIISIIDVTTLINAIPTLSFFHAAVDIMEMADPTFWAQQPRDPRDKLIRVHRQG
ncbi:38529_t:CDS:2 [Gigaspora margarita]|uniref:38529_t:CDS:1 n=1 Tax=Gigaspora margarita TaxID=4874 RepID=A0ABM8W2B4_GIGMA|nr:38529_t:CDS:2 [Gigaspora margarita]